LTLSPREQGACWADLDDLCRRELEDEFAYERSLGEEPPKRRSVLHGTPHSPSTGSNRVDLDHGDPLKQIPASQYLPALTGEVVSSTGRTRCPSPHHPDEHPSAKCYGTRWVCFGCGAGGSIIDVAAAIYGIEPTGSGYWEIRRRLLADLGVGRPV
jgi:hypothetical protein